MEIKKPVAILCCMLCISSLICGCNSTVNRESKTESDKSNEESNIDGKIKVNVNDWEIDDALISSSDDSEIVKKEITISDGKSYFAMIERYWGTIIPIPNGKGKYTDTIKKENDLPAKVEIGALFEMQNPDEIGINIKISNIESKVEKESEKNDVFISADIIEDNKKSFLLFYEIISGKDKTIDYGYDFIENGEGHIRNWFLTKYSDDYSIKIDGVYTIKDNDSNYIKIDENYDWKYEEYEELYRASKQIKSEKDNVFGVGIAKEYVDNKYKQERLFFVYNGEGRIVFNENCDEKKNVNYEDLKNVLPVHSFEIIGFSDSVISEDLYNIEYASSNFSKEIKDKLEDEKERNSIKEPAIGMTAEEVKKSTWGEPSEINKTITEYGVYEQWVYPDNQYIYLDDGIVTSIQKHE